MVKRGNMSTSPVVARRLFATQVRVRPAVFATLSLATLTLATLSLAGCGGSQPGSFDVEESGQSKLNDLVNMVQFKKMKPALDPSNPVKCPDIVIMDGTADDRVYASSDQSNGNLKFQFSITDIARDCQVSGDKMSLRVGVAGKLLLGPMGSPGSFSGPVRVAVVDNNDQSAVASKLYQVGVSIPAGQSEGRFSLVTEPFDVPYPHQKAQLDYTIKVGFDTAGDKKHPAGESAAHHHRRHGDATPAAD